MASPEPRVSSAAIVTGGGRGIGRAISIRLARSMPVIVVGRTESDLDAVCTECDQNNGIAIPIVGDISDRRTSHRAVALVKSRGWELQHVVCNAGIGKSGPTSGFDPDTWCRIFDVNVHGSFYLIRESLPILTERPGSAISIISSLAGTTGVAFDAAYSASKHALVGLARSLVKEHAKDGLIVAALCPSFIESDMTERTIRGVMRRRGLSHEDAEKRVAERCPARRILSAIEVAETVALVGDGDLERATIHAKQGGYPLISNLTEMKRDQP